MTLQPLLDHRPELQKTIAKGLADADRVPRPIEGAFVLRDVLGKVRATVYRRPMARAEAAAPPSTGGGATLWERLGGEANVRRVAADFVAALAADPKVDFSRGGKYKLDAAALAGLRERMVQLASAVGEGPHRYGGRTMKEAHKGMGITDAEFDAAVGHLKKALQKNGVRPEDVETMVGAVESKRADFVEK
jgi:hemoglobin